MNIKKAAVKEMLRLWGYEEFHKASPTAQFFSEKIAADNAQFWAIEFGFITKIKDCFVDPCAVDGEKKPLECPCFYLMCKKL